MRLEDKASDKDKGLWLVSYTHSPDYPLVGDEWERVIIVEALTAPGARAILETLDLVGDGMDLRFAGPINRLAWPREKVPWYEWLDETDPRLAAFLGGAQDPT